MEYIAIIVLPLIFIVLPVVIAKFMLDGHKKKLEPLADRLGGETHGSVLQGLHLLFERKGRRFKIEILPSKDSRPAQIVLTALGPLGIELYLTPRDALSKKLLQRRPGKGFQTSDPEFDRAFEIKTSPEPGARAFFSDQRKRDAIAALGREGFQSLHAKEEGLALSRPIIKDDDLSPSTIERHATWLYILIS